MIIGLPREIKDNEYRVALTPGGAKQLVEAGHRVMVQTGAGAGSGFPDAKYRTAGAQIVSGAADAWNAEIVIKVKEPQPGEYDFMQPDLVLFTFLHLAADQDLTMELVRRRVTGIAYETVELPDGRLPLLVPMSEVAGRLAVQVGAYYLEKTNGGPGKLLGGVPGVKPAEVAVLGGGVVGTSAASMALGMGAQVTILDMSIDRLRYLEEVLHGRLITISPNPLNIAEAVEQADILIGAVLIKGGKSPRLVTRSMVKSMKKGSVIVDVAVDQGGCIETIRPTTHSKPIYQEEGVIHYGVTNMPAAVPWTSTYALSNATLPYLMDLACRGPLSAIKTNPNLARGVNTFCGRITYRAVAESFGLEYTPLTELW
ncbi:MAG: alanine dehydrogenase [bacterium]